MIGSACWADCSIANSRICRAVFVAQSSTETFKNSSSRTMGNAASAFDGMDVWGNPRQPPTSFSPHRQGGPETAKVTERGASATQNISYAISAMKGWRHAMEDTHVHCTAIPVHATSDLLLDHSIFCVFDGHGGNFTSQYLRTHFMNVFSRRTELVGYVALAKNGVKSRADVNGVELMKLALIETFKELDANLIPVQNERNERMRRGELAPPPESESDTDDEIVATDAGNTLERSGATCVAVVLTPSHVICANTGDSRAILRRYGKVLPLSFDHKPSGMPERLRIQAAGGTVQGKRIDGDLAVSRAFGDYTYKQNRDLDEGAQKVSVVPDIIVYPRDRAGDEFIILACDGIWDVASSNQCSDFCQKLLGDGEADLGLICEEALDTCLERHSRDNMTIGMIGLPAIKCDRSSTAQFHNALWGHRTTRQVRRVWRTTADATQHTLDCAAHAASVVGREIGIEA